MHYVLIVGSYYPSFSAVGKCMGNIADELSKSNSVTVICEKTSISQTENETYNNQKLIRVSTPFRLKVLRESADEQAGQTVRRIKNQMRRFQRAIKRILASSSVDEQLVRAYEKALESVDEKIDVIIPTCSPFDSVVAALNYKKNHRDVIMCPCLFDLFAENTNLNLNKLNKVIKYRKNISLERSMLEESRAVFHVDNWSDHIAEAFPSFTEKCKCIEHPLLLVDPEAGAGKKSVNEKIHAVYMGVVDTKIRNPEKALEIIDRINDSNIVFDFYAYGSAQDILERYSKKNQQIVFCGKVDSETADKRRNGADILVSIGNSDYSQTPSKLIEYIATGKPILHFAKDMDDPAVKLLNKYPNSMIVDVSQDTDAGKITEFIENNSGKVVSFNEIIRIFRNADPQFITTEIAKICSDGLCGGGYYKLIFSGSLRKGYVEPDRIVELFSHPLLKDMIVTFYSAGNGVDTIRKCKTDNIKLGNWLSRPELEKELDKADALISIAEISGKQMSSKIFDYMSFRKPIIHVYYDENDVNLKYLNYYSDSFCVKADENTEEAACWIALLLRIRGRHASSPTYDKTLYECTPNYICEEMVKWIMNN